MGVRIALDPTDAAIPSDCTLYYNQNQSQDALIIRSHVNSIVLNTTELTTKYRHQVII
jgi:hypothetical protein